MHEDLLIKGAREHNLKNITVSLPRDRLVVITGLSGSGKSSLAFDTIYAEGQRRYVESLSAYARQFLELMEKPDVDSIDGLSPAISIEQKTSSRNPRSTVGTITEVYDYLRLLYARIGHVFCYGCGRQIASQTVQQIVDQVKEIQEGTKLMVLAPVVKGRKGEFKKELDEQRKKGFVRVRVDGELYTLDGEIKIDRRRNHTIEVVVDRLIVKPNGETERRLGNSIEKALELADDTVIINTHGGGDRLFSSRLACPHCGISMPEITPRTFSFNSSHGACRNCKGLGLVHDFDPARIVPDPSRTLSEGAIAPWTRGDKKLVKAALTDLNCRYEIPLDVPFGKLPRRLRGPARRLGRRPASRAWYRTCAVATRRQSGSTRR